MPNTKWIHDLTEEWPDLRSNESVALSVLSKLVDRLIECLRTNETSAFTNFFEQVEQHLIYGDESIRNLLLVHLLEQLKNVAASQDIDYAAFEPWLQPETMIAWRWLEKRWQGKGSLADQVRSASDDEHGNS